MSTTGITEGFTFASDPLARNEQEHDALILRPIPPSPHLGPPQVARGARRAPHLTMDPQEDGSWLVAVMVTQDGEGSWAIQRFAADELEHLAGAWRSDPEGTLSVVFGVSPPHDGLGPRPVTEVAVPVTMEDFFA